MKKIVLLALASVLFLLPQCKKNTVTPVEDNGFYMTLTAGCGDRTAFTPLTGEFVWSDGETEYIYVGGSNHTNCLGKLSGTGTGTGSMTFSGTLTTMPSNGETLYFFYLGKGAEKTGTALTTLDFSTQDGTLANVTDYHIAVGTGSYSSGSINYATTLEMKSAIAFFDVSGFGSSNVVYVHGNDVYSTATVDYQNGMITGNTKGYINVGTSGSGKYVALIPSVTTETVVKFDSNTKTGSLTFNRGIQAGKYYANGNDALAVTAHSLPEGAAPGLFSISATEKVRFSQGNLQYRSLGAPDAGVWRFAEHQYDFVGDATNGTVGFAGIKSNNALISVTTQTVGLTFSDGEPVGIIIRMIKIILIIIHIHIVDSNMVLLITISDMVRQQLWKIKILQELVPTMTGEFITAYPMVVMRQDYGMFCMEISWVIMKTSDGIT